jgi:hypothetical protein
LRVRRRRLRGCSRGSEQKPCDRGGCSHNKENGRHAFGFRPGATPARRTSIRQTGSQFRRSGPIIPIARQSRHCVRDFLARAPARLERDGIRLNRHRALDSYLSMIFSENRHPLFRIML